MKNASREYVFCKLTIVTLRTSMLYQGHPCLHQGHQGYIKDIKVTSYRIHVAILHYSLPSYITHKFIVPMW